MLELLKTATIKKTHKV